MQVSASPWTGQMRRKNTFAFGLSVRHTSAGQATWQTGQRLVVRLSSCSVAEQQVDVSNA